MRTIRWVILFAFAFLCAPTLGSAQVDPYLKQKQDQILRPTATVQYGDATGSGVTIFSGEVGEGNTKRIETFVLTNHHVVKEAIEDKRPVNVSWIQYDSKSREIGSLVRTASVFVHDEDHDIALLRLHDNENARPHVARIAPVGVRLEIMERVWTVGAALAEPPLPSEGMLASMDVYMSGGTRYIRAQMYANRGSSGGGLFHYSEERGFELVGVLTAIAMHQVSGAKKLPADDIKEKTEDSKVIRMRTEGNISFSLPPEVLHGFLLKVGSDIGIDFFK